METMKNLRGEITLLLVALLFGLSYIFQTRASFNIGPYSFGMMRYLVSSICLLPFAFKKDGTSLKEMIKIGVIMGFLLFAACAAQQFAAGKTESGKLGFITSLYIVMVPLIKWLVYKKKINKRIVLAVVLAVVGLYYLCNLNSLNINPYDFLLLIAAFAYAIEIIYVDEKGTKLNPMKFIFASSFGAFVFFLVMVLLKEKITLVSIELSLIDILYVGVASGAIGYSLQVIGQSEVDETRASLIMSLEAVISIFAGIIFLKEVFSIRELFGCVLMFISVLLCIKNNY